MTREKTAEEICSLVVRALKEERQRQGISMEALAAKAALSQSMISLIERDLRNPTLDTLLRIAAALKVELGAIITSAGATSL